MTQALNTGDIDHKVRTMIAEQLHIAYEAVTLDATLVSLGADSLDIVEMIVHLDEEFDIEISDEAAESLHTVRDLIQYVTSLLQ